MLPRRPGSTPLYSSSASYLYKRQVERIRAIDEVHRLPDREVLQDREVLVAVPGPAELGVVDGSGTHRVGCGVVVRGTGAVVKPADVRVVRIQSVGSHAGTDGIT